MPDRPTLLEDAQEEALRSRALEMLRAAFPDYRIVHGGGRWAAAAAGDPPQVWFADTPSSLCGQLFLAELTSGGRVRPINAGGAKSATGAKGAKGSERR